MTISDTTYSLCRVFSGPLNPLASYSITRTFTSLKLIYKNIEQLKRYEVDLRCIHLNILKPDKGRHLLQFLDFA